MKYRAEIDGLRALAVIPVIFFHAGFEAFSGGFVGVDVFFVISGYLITTILIEELGSNKFSIIGFYERRARRILPALFLMMFVCVPFAWLSMFPSQLVDFSHSLIAVSLFASNILFWQESGYFAAAAEEKPLLHTWSLAVEEQFYLIFPIFILFLWKFGRNKIFWILVLLALSSLILSEWGWRHRARANFYLAPTRAWELLAGSISAFLIHKRGVRSSNFLSFIGLCAILFAIFTYDETTPFPSIYALIPVIGVVLLILYGKSETVVAKILATKVFVSIGLISYSVYLWHQPVFAFYRLRSIKEVSISIYAFLILIILIISIFSWKFVEKPFRNRNLFDTKVIFKLSFIGLLFFISLGAFLQVQSENIRKEVVEYKELEYLSHWRGWVDCETDLFILDKRGGCKVIKPDEPINYMVIGDSHAGHIAYGIRDLAIKLNKNFMIVFSAGCYPGINENGNLFDCKDDHIRKAVNLAVNTPSVKGVILSGYGVNKLRGDRFTDRNKSDVGETQIDQFRRGLEKVVQTLIDGQKTVVIVADNPEMPTKTPGKCLLIGNCDAVRVSRKNYELRSRDYNMILGSLVEKFERLLVLYPHDKLCDQEWCYGSLNDKLLYQSDDHLTPRGSLFVIESLFDDAVIKLFR